MLASIVMRLGRDDEAERQLRRALQFARAAGARDPHTAALLGLAACRHTPLEQAIAFAEEALDIATRAGLRILEGDAHIALADLYRHRGDRVSAVTHARKGLSMHRESGHRLGQARALHVLIALIAGDDTNGIATARAEVAALLAAIGAPTKSLALDPAGSRAG